LRETAAKEATNQIFEKMMNQGSEESQRLADTEIDVTKEEENLVEAFVHKFLITSERSLLDHVNIVLFLKAVPGQVVDYNLDQTELFNFKIIQDSLIAYQNRKTVNAFAYFDRKNGDRVAHVRT